MNVLISNLVSIQDILANATNELRKEMGFSEARLQAELLLAHTMQTSRSMLLARLDEAFSPELAAECAANVARRTQHEPLAYILGHIEFFGLDFVIDRRVLIPRHETELIVQIALERARGMPSPVIVDVGTGSGAIALSLAHHLADAQIIATDISSDALAAARNNATELGLGNVRFVECDLLARVDEPFDLLVANLPYIPSVRYNQLPCEVRDYEPRLALDGGCDGLEVVRRLLRQINRLERRPSIALFEISEEQGNAMMELVHRELPLEVTTLHRDLEGMDRVVQVQFGTNSRI